MQLTNEQRQTLDKYLPWMLAALVAWLFTRGLRRMFWTLFGLFWIMHWTGGWHAWF